MEIVKEKDTLENPIIAEEVKIGVCEGEPKDGFVIAFKGECATTKETAEASVIIPIDGIPELIQILFAAGMTYQEDTGVDIGFADVIKEKNNE